MRGRLEHEVRHIERAVGKKLSHARHPLESQRKIDEFMKPVQHSRLAHSQAAASLRAVLEERARHGQDPQEYMRELEEKSRKEIQQHTHELRFAIDFLRTLKQGNHIPRVKEEILVPVQQRSISGSEAWNRMQDLPGYHRNRTPLIGGTVGIGGAVGASALIGGAVCEEFIGARYLCPARYVGVEVSLGLQLGVNLDAVVEVGFVPPENFGGPYVGVGIAGAFGVGAIIQVSWALPDGAFQGFTVGLGGGAEVEVAAVLGDGWVVPLLN